MPDFGPTLRGPINLRKAREIADHPDGYTYLDIMRALEVIHAVCVYITEDLKLWEPKLIRTGLDPALEVSLRRMFWERNSLVAELLGLSERLLNVANSSHETTDPENPTQH